MAYVVHQPAKTDFTSSMIFTRFIRVILVLSPICPKSFRPHIQRLPSSLMIPVVCPPADTYDTLSSIFVGVYSAILELLPNSPQYCLPHIQRLPSFLIMA